MINMLLIMKYNRNIMRNYMYFSLDFSEVLAYNVSAGLKCERSGHRGADQSR